MLSSYGKREWITILLIGVMISATVLVFRIHWWPLAAVVAVATLALLAFFRDPNRSVPSQRGVMVSPADGVVSSVHQVEGFEPLGEAAQCVRIFLSVLDVHVNRSPCHGLVRSVTHRPGKHTNALNPDSAEVNEAVTTLLVHPTRKHPVAAVRQVAGLIARTIVCGCKEGDILQRGQRYGLIKFGSTTELYVPLSASPRVLVQRGQRVRGGETLLMEIKGAPGTGLSDDPEPEGAGPAPVTVAPVA